MVIIKHYWHREKKKKSAAALQWKDLYAESMDIEYIIT